MFILPNFMSYTTRCTLQHRCRPRLSCSPPKHTPMPCLYLLSSTSVATTPNYSKVMKHCLSLLYRYACFILNELDSKADSWKVKGWLTSFVFLHCSSRWMRMRVTKTGMIENSPSARDSRLYTRYCNITLLTTTDIERKGPKLIRFRHHSPSKISTISKRAGVLVL
jgi:hypothetical protein